MDAEDWPRVTASRTARFVLRGRLAAMARRATPLELAFREDQSLRHVAEVLGIPACEIGSAFADGEGWPLELPPPDAATIELLPWPEPLPLAARPRFVADTQLGRLARELRLLGFDALWRGELDQAEGDELLVELVLGEGRFLLTRDRALLFRRELSRPDPEGLPRCALLLSREAYGQLLETCARFGLAPLWQPLSLCSACGARLERASKAEILPLLPPTVARRCEDFRRCPACGKIFWKGDHARSIEPLLARLGEDLGSPARNEA